MIPNEICKDQAVAAGLYPSPRTFAALLEAALNADDSTAADYWYQGACVLWVVMWSLVRSAVLGVESPAVNCKYWPCLPPHLGLCSWFHRFEAHNGRNRMLPEIPAWIFTDPVWCQFESVPWVLERSAMVLIMQLVWQYLAWWW